MSSNFKLNNLQEIPLYYHCIFAFLLLETIILFIFLSDETSKILNAYKKTY